MVVEDRSPLLSSSLKKKISRTKRKVMILALVSDCVSAFDNSNKNCDVSCYCCIQMSSHLLFHLIDFSNNMKYGGFKVIIHYSNFVQYTVFFDIVNFHLVTPIINIELLDKKSFNFNIIFCCSHAHWLHLQWLNATRY